MKVDLIKFGGLEKSFLSLIFFLQVQIIVVIRKIIIILIINEVFHVLS